MVKCVTRLIWSKVTHVSCRQRCWTSHIVKGVICIILFSRFSCYFGEDIQHVEGITWYRYCWVYPGKISIMLNRVKIPSHVYLYSVLSFLWAKIHVLHNHIRCNFNLYKKILQLFWNNSLLYGGMCTVEIILARQTLMCEVFTGHVMGDDRLSLWRTEWRAEIGGTTTAPNQWRTQALLKATEINTNTWERETLNRPAWRVKLHDVLGLEDAQREIIYQRSRNTRHITLPAQMPLVIRPWQRWLWSNPISIRDKYRRHTRLI